MGLLDMFMGNPAMQKATAAIEAGLVKREKDTKAALNDLIARVLGGAAGDIKDEKLKAQAIEEIVNSNSDKILVAASHGNVIREIAKVLGIDLLRTLADKLDKKS